VIPETCLPGDGRFDGMRQQNGKTAGGQSAGLPDEVVMAIEVRNLTKFYGKKLGCRDISFEVGKGEVFGLLGPNGAGKSTLVKMLVGLVFPTSGKARVLGKPLGDVATRKRLGYLPENFKYQEWMTGADLLSFHCSLGGMDMKKAAVKRQEVLETVKLTGQEKYRVGTYSKGMQQRIGLACALLTDPDVLFLDEPTSAMDPIGRREVREIITDLKDRGKTVMLNSHLLSEVEMICTSVAFIREGAILRYAAMEEFQKPSTTVSIRVKGLPEQMLAYLKQLDPGLQQDGEKIRLVLPGAEDIPGLAAAITNSGARLYELTPGRESLESIFFNIVEGGKQAT
jgi:ABC-2 type transport system ATP-binding protein